MLITDETRRRLDDGFEIRARGSHELKGIDEPIVLHAPKVPRRERSASARESAEPEWV